MHTKFTPEQRAAWDRHVQSVLKQASGNWGFVIESLAPPLGAVIAKAGKHTYCPNPAHSHQKNGDAMRILPKEFHATGAMVCNTCGMFADGVAVLRWWFNWSFGDVIKAIDQLFNGAGRSFVPAQPAATREPDPEEIRQADEKTHRKLQQTWDGAFPLEDPRAAVGLRYLTGARGLDASRLTGLPHLRVHPRLRYHDGEGRLVGEFPALLYVITLANGRPGSLHRTYLAHDGSGKADVPVPKKVMSRASDRPLSGGACRMDTVPGVLLNLAEGLETALSVREISGLPTWPTYSANLMETIEVPEHVRYVAFWGDFDPHNNRGQMAAEKGVQRMREQGRKAVAIYPTYALRPGEHKLDWNDALRRFGAPAIRQQAFFRSFVRNLEQMLRADGLSREALHGLAA